MDNRDICILVVEDDPQILRFIGFALEHENYGVRTATTGKEAEQALIESLPDLVVLDLGLPDQDGMDILRALRTWSDIPVIIVSARDREREKVEALDAGADDYLTKPFSAAELTARLRVALRHLERERKNPEKFQVGDLELHPGKRYVALKGEEIHLTPLEYDLLSLLFRHQGKVLTTGTILREIYGAHYGNDTGALRTLMAGLRRKIEDTPAKPRYIRTEIGVGYRMVDE